MSADLPARGMFGYQPELEQEVFRLQSEEYKGRTLESIAGNWRWMFVDSANRLSMRPQVWVFRKESQVVAHQGAIPVLLHIRGSDPIPTGWFVETLAAERVRGTAIGPMLIQKARDDMPTNLSLGQTEQMRELQYALGWRRICGLTKFVFVSGSRMNLRNKLPPGLAEFAAASLALRASHKWKRLMRMYGSKFQVQPVARFTDEHLPAWTRMADTCACAVVRDPSYLNWKYIDRASREFHCISLLDDNGVAGIVVAMVAEANDVYPYRRGYLVDFVTALDREDLLAALIAHGVAYLRDEGAQTVTCQAANQSLSGALELFGFSARSSRFHFLVCTGKLDDRMARIMLEPDSWFVTLGDSDADSYPD